MTTLSMTSTTTSLDDDDNRRRRRRRRRRRSMTTTMTTSSTTTMTTSTSTSLYDDDSHGDDDDILRWWWRRRSSCVKAFQCARTVVNSFVISRINYYNCFLAGGPQHQLNRLQAVMNSAGRLVCGLNTFDRIRCVLRDWLHWLPVPQQIQYKLCLLVYKALRGFAPQYPADFCQPVSSVSARSRLWSSTRGDLVVVSTATNFGRRCFAVSAPLAWNRLPPEIRNNQLLESFKSQLKTHLFKCID